MSSSSSTTNTSWAMRGSIEGTPAGRGRIRGGARPPARRSGLEHVAQPVTRTSTCSIVSCSRARSSSAPASTSSQVSGAAAVGRSLPRSEYGEIVVLDPEFCDQSRNTFPGRFAFVIVAVTRSGCSFCSASATSLASAVVPSLSRSSGPCGQGGVEVETLAAAHHRRAAQVVLGQRVAHHQRDLRALVEPGRLAGVEVDDQPVGVARGAVGVDVHWWTCSSRAARLASQVRVARSSQIGKRIVPSPLPAREPVVGTSCVRTHDGVPDGAFFSKKLDPSTPCGQRIRVTARSARCGSRTGETGRSS